MVLAYACCLRAVIISTPFDLRNGSHLDETLYSCHTEIAPNAGKDLIGSVGGILLDVACWLHF